METTDCPPMAKIEAQKRRQKMPDIAYCTVTTDPPKKIKKTLDRFLGEKNSISRCPDKFLRYPPCVQQQAVFSVILLFRLGKFI